MSREILSQDEIDVLLKQNNLQEDENLEINLDDFLSPFDQDALGEIGNISFGSASTALSTLLGQKVEITTPRVSAIESDALEEEFPTPHVAIHVEYTKGFKGISLFVIKAEDAKIIADLMLGGTAEDVKGKELTDMDISAVQEAMNQMMGSAATSMSTVFNTTVNISPPGVDILDVTKKKGSEKLPDDKIFVLVSFRLKIGNLIDSNIMQLTSIDFAKEMISKLLGTSGEQEETDAAEYQETAVISSNNKNKTANDDKVTNQKAATGMGNTRGINSNVNVQTAQFSDLKMNNNIKNEDANLGLLLDIPLQITVELGRTKKLIKEILEISQGSVIELDKLAGEPVDIFANNKLIAKGEVVVIDENFGVRVTDIISQYDRVRKLQ